LAGGFFVLCQGAILEGQSNKLELVQAGARSNGLKSRILLTIFMLLLATGPARGQSARLAVRAGYFPNVTHSQPLSDEHKADLIRPLVPVRASSGKSSTLDHP